MTLVAGICEEVIFRGIFMHAVGRRWGVAAGVLVPSVTFAIVHVLAGPIDTVGFFMLLVGGTASGIMFSMIALVQDSIWNSAIVHGSWDAVIIGIFSIYATGSGKGMGHLFMKHLDSSSLLLTGGDFGIEVSVVCLVAYAVVSGYAYRQYRLRIRGTEA